MKTATELLQEKYKILRKFQDHPRPVRSHVVVRARYGCRRKQRRTKDDRQSPHTRRIDIICPSCPSQIKFSGMF